MTVFVHEAIVLNANIAQHVPPSLHGQLPISCAAVYDHVGS